MTTPPAPAGPPAVLSVGDVLAMLPAARALAGDWRAQARFDPAQKIRLVLRRDEQAEVLLQFWSPGQASGFHDHGRTVGVAEVLEGTIEETVLRAGRGPVGKPRSFLYSAGGSLVFEDGKLHRMRCTPEGRAVTLHIYSPPLGAVGRYDPEDAAAGRTAVVYPAERSGGPLDAPALVALARALGARFAGWDATVAGGGRFPESNFRLLDAAGLLLAPLRVEDGGAGAALADALACVGGVARGSPATACCLATHYAVAGLYRLPPAALPAAARAAFEKQRSWHAFAVRSGLRFGASLSALETLAGTERLAGDCVAARADGRGFTLDGHEDFVSIGGAADFFLCAARDEAGARHFFLVDRHSPGVRVGDGWNGLAPAPATRALELAAVRVAEPVATPPAGAFAGHWWPLGLAAVLLGAGERILALAAAEAGDTAHGRAAAADAFLRLEAAGATLAHVAAADGIAAADPAPHAALRRRAARAAAFVTREVAAIAGLLGTLGGGAVRPAPAGAGAAAGEIDRLVRDATLGPRLLSPVAIAMDEVAVDLALWLRSGS